MDSFPIFSNLIESDTGPSPKKKKLGEKIEIVEKKLNPTKEIKEKIDDIFQISQKQNGKYGRGINCIKSSIKNVFYKLDKYYETISNLELKYAAQLYAGLIKVDNFTFLIRTKVVAKNMGLAQSSVNYALKDLSVRTVISGEGKVIIDKTFLKNYPCLYRKWSIRKSEVSLFEKEKVDKSDIKCLDSNSHSIYNEIEKSVFDLFDTYSDKSDQE